MNNEILYEFILNIAKRQVKKRKKFIVLPHESSGIISHFLLPIESNKRGKPKHQLFNKEVKWY